MTEPTLPPGPPTPPPHAPLHAPPPPPPKGTTPWGKIALFGCLILFVLGIAIGAIGFFVYRVAKDRQKEEAVAEEATTTPDVSTPGVTGGVPTTPGGAGAATPRSVPPGPRQVLSGTIEAGDAVRDDGSWYEAWTLEPALGERVVVTMEAPAFDAYLTVVSPSGEFYSDDDGAGGTDSRVEVSVNESGSWAIWANTLHTGDSGSYTLTVERSGP